jgi:hypothetical protein
MLQGQNQPNRLHPPERMCKDLRSMQLFAEQVLAYRGGQSPQRFCSYGFHEPNTDEGRHVYTIADDRIYYFLPQLNPEAVHRVFAHLQTLVRDQFGRNPAIQQVVIVGESSTTDDRARLQEAVDNYQFTTTPESTPQTESEPPPEAMGDHRPAVIDNSPQLTMLPSATPKPLPIRRTLSYINEDPYWDPRQDDLGTTRDGILHDRAGTITSWLQQQPNAIHTPQFTAQPSPQTALQTPETELQAAAVPIVDPPRAPEPPYEPSRTGLQRRQQATAPMDWSLGGLMNNWRFLLAGIGIVSAALWLMRGDFRPPSQVGSKGNQLVSPPPPPIADRPTPNQGQSSTTFNTPKKSAVPGAATVPPRRVIPTPPTPRSGAGFFVRSPTPYDGVNLRVGPGMNNGKIRAVPNGYWLVDEGRQIGIWREVSFQGQRGWVYRPFIR